MGSENSKGGSSQRQQTQRQESTIGRRQNPESPLQHQSNVSPVPQPQPNLERSRAPYSYTNTDLANTVRQANAQNLYPNLDNVNRTLAPQRKPEPPVCNVYPDVKQNNGSPSGATGRNGDSYVIVTPFLQRVFLKPSAPPAADVGGVPETASNFNQTRNSQPRYEPNNPGPSTSSSCFDENNKPCRPRSVSRNRANNQADDIGVRLSCPTCAKRLGLTIFNCAEGHGSCGDCRQGNKRCGSARCGAPITQMRNISLEECVAMYNGTRTAQCQNDNCTLRFDLVGMEKHLKECPFGEMDCPMGTFFGQCSYRCKVDALASHFDACHKDQRAAEFDKEMFIFNICMEVQKLYLIKNGPYNFLVHIKVSQQDRMIYMTVQLLGTAVSASKWTFEFHVFNKRQPRRKFQYTDQCQSIGTALDSIFNESKCVTLPIAYAMSFVNASALTYKFFIKKTETRPKKRYNPRMRQNVDN